MQKKHILCFLAEFFGFKGFSFNSEIAFTGKWVLVLFLFSCSFSLFAQKKVIRFQYYTTEEGLPQNMVDCIHKDSKGFMWFGTWNGLSRFDGYTFTIYKSNTKIKNTLSDNFIRSLCEDRYGNLWIATNRGLNVFIYEQERFITHFHDPSDKKSLISDRINCIIGDQSGKIWVGTDKGLDILTIGDEGIIHRIDHFSEYHDLPGTDIQVIYEEKRNLFWIGTNNGLVRYNKAINDLKSFVNIPADNKSLSENNVNTVFNDDQGFLWIGTNFGLNRMDTLRKSFTQYYHNPLDPSSLSHNSVLSINKDLNGNLLIGTLGGVSFYQASSDNFINYHHQLNSTYGLNNEFINCIYPDREGNIWIGTERGGINKFNIYLNYFEFFEHEPGNYNSLSHKTVNCIWEDEKYIWIGTAGGGLNKYDKKNNRYAHYRYEAGNPDVLPIDFITSLYGDNQNNLWIGTWGGGLHKLTQKNSSRGYFIHFRPDPTDTTSLINDFISTIITDKWGYLWIGTLGGLDKFNPLSGKFEHVSVQNNNKQINQVGCLQFDKDNNLWVGTIQGLFKIYAGNDGVIDPARCSVKYFENEPGNIHSISGNYVISICSDQKGTLWFGTYGNGINKRVTDSLNPLIEYFQSYSEEDGLSNNIVYGILEDKAGNLWLSTDNGLSLFNVKKEDFRNFYLHDGIQGNQFYWSAYYKNPEGKLYFGGMNGLTSFYPDKITGYKFEPTTKITDFKIFNESVTVGKEYFGRVILNKSVTDVNRLIISYKAREFGFEFSALDFDQPEKISYQYKLKGFDDQWINVDANRRYANFTNLKGGEYVFQVRAINEEGKIQSKPTELSLKIIPPIWAMLWFRISFLILIIAMVLFYIRYRVYSLEKQKKKLEILVKERTTKIEEQKEELVIQAEYLKESNIQLEKKKEEIEGQKIRLERQNTEILEQRDRLVELNKKVQLINQQQLKFFTHISHEFRTPLTLISAPVEQMIGELKKDTYFKRKLQLVYKNTQRLLHLINQLMEIRKVETGKIELRTSKADMVHFIRNISQSFSELAENKKIEYDFITEFEKLEIYFDNDKLENIIYNLLSNAFKYTPEHGRITICIAPGEGYYEKDKVIPVIDRHHYKQYDIKDFIEISIADSGIGIEHNHIKDIFRRFYRINSQPVEVKGTGIGLFLVKEMVKAHKGLLFVKSEMGMGSKFIVMLPAKASYLTSDEIIDDRSSVPDKSGNIHVKVLSEGTAEYDIKTGSGEREEISMIPNGKPLLLLIDDDRELLSVTTDFLSHAFRVIQAENGTIGMKNATRFSPDLIISDIMMPEIDGLELCNMLKSNLSTSHIPVILLTARSEVEDLIEGLESGADDYISKPFNIKILEAKSKSLIENRNRLRKLFSQSLIPVPKEITTNRTDEDFLQRTIKVVESNINNSEFSVNKLASELCISRSLLHKKLTSIVDLSANDFITSMRIKKSALLLLEGNFNISEVAFEVGFNDPKYFSRRFKQHYGISPSDYSNGKSNPGLVKSPNP